MAHAMQIDPSYENDTTVKLPEDKSISQILASLTSPLSITEEKLPISPKEILPSSSPTSSEKPQSLEPTINTVHTTDMSKPIYGPGLDQTALKQALDQQQDYQRLLAIAQGGQTMGAALGRIKPVDLNSLEKLGSQPIEAIKLQRAAMDEQLQSERQALALATEKDKMDPNSAASKIYRDTLQKMGIPIDPSASAMSLEKGFPAIEKYFMAKDKNDTLKMQREMMSIQKQDIMATKEQDKKIQKQAIVTKQVDQFLNGARSEPSVRLAEADAYNTQKIDDILIQYGQDINKIKTNMVPVVIAEVAKVAKGGVPDRDELNRMMPSSVQFWLASTEGKVLNDAQAAQAKGFLNDYFKYAKNIQKNAQKTILDRYGRVLLSNKNKMDPNDYDIRQQQYLGRFGIENDKLSKEKINNIDQQAIEWAQQHKDDPRAQKILQIHGM